MANGEIVQIYANKRQQFLVYPCKKALNVLLGMLPSPELSSVWQIER